ncbi:glycosyltransferase family 4 protein [Frateuria sp.]|uniref:glycosyltransferase family 4 protein n=1 Tax=Frateuria sp. TaxID=2211372 RepID=UPI003F7F16B3
MKPQNRKQVLVFMLAPPLPAVAGGDIYAVNALAPFTEEIDYHLFCFVGGNEDVRKVESHRHLYRQVFKSVHLEKRPLMPFQMPRVRRAVRLFRHALRGLPFIDASYCSRSAVRAARRIVRRHRVDALEINSSHLAFFRKFLHRPALLVSHNIESDIFPFWLPNGLHGWRLRFMEWVARRSRHAAHRVEIENGFGFAAMTFISANDMQRVIADVPKYLMPLYFKKEGVPYEQKTKERFNVLWMGGFGWYPNAEGVGWFVREIFPGLREALVANNIALHFCGSNPPDELSILHDGTHVFVHGFVEDIDYMLREAHLLIVPLLSGGGIRVKIVEAMSAGVPVLSTSKGCEGIGAVDGRDIIIRDDPSAFGKEIILAAQEPARMHALSVAGLRLMNECYSESASLGAKRMAYERVGVL